MIKGSVHSWGDSPITGAPRVSITVVNISEPNRTLTVNAIVDTAFTAHLTLPLASIEKLGLLSRGKQPAVLANGMVGDFPVYAGLVSWDGHRRLIPIFESDSEPLLGMAMLWGSRLIVDAWEGGDVVIKEVPH
ncbi:MAG: clan AA aspartic protease [Chloroflexi bacterium]|nr:clan AA aspartic protease [Chloroflexota bacterium]